MEDAQARKRPEGLARDVHGVWITAREHELLWLLEGQGGGEVRGWGTAANRDIPVLGYTSTPLSEMFQSLNEQEHGEARKLPLCREPVVARGTDTALQADPGLDGQAAGHVQALPYL